jgi:hypothetical protein
MSLEDLIAAERAQPAEPTVAEAKSLWKRIRGGAGAVVPPAFDVSPASTVVTLKMKIAAAVSSAIGKIVVGTAVVGTVAGGTAAVIGGQGEREAAVVVERSPDEAPARERPAAEATEPAVVAPVEAVPEIEPVDPVPEVEPVEAPAVVAPEPVSEPTRSKRRARPEASTFGDEFALIRKAQRALAGGRANAALVALAEHERRFPKGSMNEDRLALRALALCSAGRRDEGRRAAKLLERRHPRSLYAERVNEACD